MKLPVGLSVWLFLAPPEIRAWRAGRPTPPTKTGPLGSLADGAGDPADPGAGDPVLLLPLMEAELAARLARPGPADRDRRAELRLSIDGARAAAELGVRGSHREFYAAVSGADAAAMRGVWSAGPRVRCVLPGMPAARGREAVMGAWERHFSVPVPGAGGAFAVEAERVEIEICGLVAICSCVERTAGDGRLEALNVYRREGGSWKMTLHQAGPVISLSGMF